MARALQTAAVLVLLTVANSAPAQDKSPQPAEQAQIVQVLLIDGEPVGTSVAPHAGEICIICNHPIAESDLTYLVHGQRVPVHRLVCNARLKEDPRVVLAGLQPRGAFLGAEMDKPGLQGAWFVFGLYILLGLFFGAVCAQRALQTGRNSVPWFLAGLAFNVVGYAALRSLPPRKYSPPAGVPSGLGKIAVTYAPVICPICGHALHPSAASCPACGAVLRPKAVSEVTLAKHTN